ncbi:MAG: FtsX-like permease family protein, partial [Acidobacteriota bacterium]
YLASSDPLPHKSGDLFYIRLDSWNPAGAFSRDHPERPPNQVTYRDALALVQSDIPTHTTAAFHSDLFVYPEDLTQRPFETSVRLCHSGFFPMFDLPFAYGGPWDARADEGPEPMVVLDHATNQRLFGGENSVGRKVRLAQTYFTVSGVLEPWRPVLKYYDVNNDANSAPEALYIPFLHVRDMEIRTDGNDMGWKDGEGEGFAGFLNSETVWIQLWAELETDEQKARYQTYLDAYTDEQRALGRFGRPNNNWIQPMREWHEEEGVVPPESKSMMVIALLFLAVCSINLIGLLLGKFLARAPEVGVRRALGASRRAIFLQHVVECQLLAVLGGLLGLLVSVGALEVVGKMLLDDLILRLDLNMVGIAFLLAVVSGLVAGVYPAWRICSVAPAIHLKTQ